MGTRPDRKLMHEWHVQINRFTSEHGHKGHGFMYEAKAAADEIPRLVIQFGRERRGELPQVHRQCSHSGEDKAVDNHLFCCLGKRCSECPILQAIERMDRSDDEKDFAKAMTCVTHIISEGGDQMNEGYVLAVDDRMFWDNVYRNLSSS